MRRDKLRCFCYSLKHIFTSQTTKGRAGRVTQGDRGNYLWGTWNRDRTPGRQQGLRIGVPIDAHCIMPSTKLRVSIFFLTYISNKLCYRRERWCNWAITVVYFLPQRHNDESITKRKLNPEKLIVISAKIWAQFPFQKKAGYCLPYSCASPGFPPCWLFGPIPLYYLGQSSSQGLSRSATGSSGIQNLWWLCGWLRR